MPGVQLYARDNSESTSTTDEPNNDTLGENGHSVCNEDALNTWGLETCGSNFVDICLLTSADRIIKT